MNCKLRTRHKGFSLAEAMIAMVVLGIAAAGVMLPFSTGAQVQASGMQRTLAVKLASDLMEDIININTPFGDIVAGYNYAESIGQVKDAGGVVFSDSKYAYFSRDVSCEYVFLGDAEANFIQATVRVKYDGEEIVKIDRLISE